MNELLENNINALYAAIENIEGYDKESQTLKILEECLLKTQDMMKKLNSNDFLELTKILSQINGITLNKAFIYFDWAVQESLFGREQRPSDDKVREYIDKAYSNWLKREYTPLVEEKIFNDIDTMWSNDLNTISNEKIQKNKRIRSNK